jgi:archaellum component FlaC
VLASNSGSSLVRTCSNSRGRQRAVEQCAAVRHSGAQRRRLEVQNLSAKVCEKQFIEINMTENVRTKSLRRKNRSRSETEAGAGDLPSVADMSSPSSVRSVKPQPSYSSVESDSDSSHVVSFPKLSPSTRKEKKKSSSDFDKLSSLITGQFAAVGGQIGEVKTEVTNQIDEVTNRIGEVTNRINEVKAEVNQQFSKVKSDMKSQINSVVTKVDRQLNEMHDELATQIVETQSEVRQEVDRVRQQVNYYVDNVSQHVDEVRQEMSNNFDVVLGQVGSLCSRLQKLESEPSAAGEGPVVVQSNGRLSPPQVVTSRPAAASPVVNRHHEHYPPVESNVGVTRSLLQHQHDTEPNQIYSKGSNQSSRILSGESYTQTANFGCINVCNTADGNETSVKTRDIRFNCREALCQDRYFGRGVDRYQSTDSNDCVDYDDINQTRGVRKLIKQNAVLPSFDGSTSLNTFLNKFKTCTEYYNWSLGDQMFQLTCALTGPAAHVINTHNGDMRSIEEIIAMLQTRFGSANQTELYRVQLKERRRLPGESLQKLYSSVLDLMAKAYPTYVPGDILDDMAKNYFLDALTDYDFKVKVACCNPRNVSEALTHALRLEALLSSDPSKKVRRHNADEDRYVRYIEDRTEIVDKPKSNWNYQKGGARSRFVNRKYNVRNEQPNANVSIAPVMHNVSEFQEANYAYNVPQSMPLSMQPGINAPVAPVMSKAPVFTNVPRHGEQIYVNNVPPYATNNMPFVGNANVTSVNNYQNRSYENSNRNEKRGRNGGRGQLGYNQCRLCLNFGHLAKACPLSQGSGEPIAAVPPVAPVLPTFDPQTNSFVSRVTTAAVEPENVYLRAKLFGRELLCLLDSGCQVTVIPNKLIPDDVQLRTSQQSLFAANRTPITVSGETELMLEVNEYPLEIHAIVSPDVSSVLLGNDFLKQNHSLWDYENSKIRLNGVWFNLTAMPTAGLVRRIYTQLDVNIPAKYQLNMPVKVTLPSLREIPPTWVTNNRVITSDVMSGNVLIKDIDVNTVVPLINVTRAEIALPKGTFLGFAVVASVASEEDELSLNQTAIKLNTMLPCDLRCEQSQPTRDVITDKSQALVKPETAILQNSIEQSEIMIMQVNTADVNDVNADFSHVQCIIDNLPAELTIAQKETVAKFVKSYADIFSRNEHDLGRTHLIKHTIDTANNPPVRETLRRHPDAHLPIIDEHVQSMLKDGIIVPSQSNYASNVTLVRRANGKFRFCIDYRKLNAQTVRDSYCIPLISSCYDVLGGAKYYSTLDQTSSYWQVLLNEQTAHKTAFLTRGGLYEFTVGAFGLTSMVATFQRLMNLVLSGLSWKMCLCFLDDVIVLSDNFENHLSRLGLVLDRIRAAGLKLKPEKCFLFRSRVKFLGFYVSQNGLEVDSERTRAIREYGQLKNTADVRTFCGLISYYRRFIKDCASLCAPLNELLRANTPFVWNERREKAFQTLKDRLCSAPVLALPRDEGKYVVDCDASAYSVSSILQQEQDGQLRVISYASRSLSKAERQYCVTRRELLGVIFSLLVHRQYLLCRHFVIRCDHSALTSLLKCREPLGKQARWMDLIAEFDFEIVYRPGLSHRNADALSRRPCAREHGCDPCMQCSKRGLDLDSDETLPKSEVSELPVNCNVISSGVFAVKTRSANPEPVIAENRQIESEMNLTPAILAAEQRADPVIAPVIDIMLKASGPPAQSDLNNLSSETLQLCSQWDSLKLFSGVLYREFINPNGSVECYQLITPDSLKNKLITYAHAIVTAGHWSANKTYENLRRVAYWFKMRSHIAEAVLKCEQCHRFKRADKTRHSPLQEWPASRPWQRGHVDLSGMFVPSNRGERYILSVIDYFSRYLILIPIRDKSALTVARALVDKVYSRFSMFEIEVSDCGSEFWNDVRLNIHRLLSIQSVKTVSYRPNLNSVVEISHKSINSMIAKVVSANQRDWSEKLPFIELAYNCAV